MDENCLTCYYEPIWGEVQTRGNYSMRFGLCRWNKKLPILPATHSVFIKKQICRYDDDSGVMGNCKTWKQKK